MKSTALITGSTGGDLILVGQNEAKLLAQKKEVEEKYKVTVQTIVANLTDTEQVDNIYNT